MDEQQIIQGLREGKREAGEALVDRFQRPLIRYFQISLPDPESAPDAAQEVFLRLIRAVREKESPAIRSLQAFLFTLARRLMIDQVRESYRRPPLDSLDEPKGNGFGGGKSTRGDSIADSRPNPRETADHRDRMQKVTEAIRSLDPEIREVTLLHHFEGMSGREIADLLHLKEGTVWSRLHQGLRILRTKLAPAPRGPGSTSSPTRPPRETRRNP